MLTPSVLIQKKRDGEELSEKEIRFLVEGFSNGEIPDYQASAFLMATYFREMTLDETVALTKAMLESGKRLNLSSVKGVKFDKHSTGGVGDKISLILAPLAAACGLKVPSMAGRGLGHSGGTVDKLESISGYDVQLSDEKFKKVLSEAGCSIIGQSAEIAPADKKLYGLRDVTGTIECVPLIVASILSKKLAEGTDGLLMDVKVGNGAFMKSKGEARTLARAIIRVARKMKLPCKALITDMNQPLGFAVGNSLEVIESIEILRNQAYLGPKGELRKTSSDVKELTVQLCAHMLQTGKLVRNITEGRKLAQQKLSDGSAWECFRKMVELHGGSLEQIEDPANKLPLSKRTVEWKAKKSGHIVMMDTRAIGQLVVEMGGGRKRADDQIDYGVGLIVHKKLGAQIKIGEPLVTAYLPTGAKGSKDGEASEKEWEQTYRDAIQISRSRKPVPKLVLEVIQ